MSDLSKALMRAAAKMRNGDAAQIAIGIAMLNLSLELVAIERENMAERAKLTEYLAENLK